MNLKVIFPQAKTEFGQGVAVEREFDDTPKGAYFMVGFLSGVVGGLRAMGGDPTGAEVWCNGRQVTVPNFPGPSETRAVLDLHEVTK